jgi:hypothetical protein
MIGIKRFDELKKIFISSLSNELTKEISQGSK